MEELSPLVFAEGRMLRRVLASVRTQPRLKTIFILFTASLIWGGLLAVFLEGFSFMYRNFSDFAPVLTDYLFSLLYMSLLIMLAFSTGIILFASLFRSEETRFLLSSPFHPETVFLFKFVESLAFSSWAFAFLAGPIILGYGLVRRASIGFYAVVALLLPPFIMIPGAIGAVAVLLICAYFPRRRKTFIVMLLALFAVLAAVPALRLLSWWRLLDKAPEIWVQGVLQRLSFCRSVWLPSYWMAAGQMAASEGHMGRAFFYLMELCANAAFVFTAAYFIASKKYLDAWSAVQGGKGGRRYSARGLVDAAAERLLFFLPFNLRLLLAKDVKTFRRDPMQWSQFLIFFGLLGIYILNLRNLSYNVRSPTWRNAVSFLNLAATSLTLATFTSRFIFPMLSLEGRQLWLLGLLPVRREGIVLGKFLFALGGALIVSEGLIVTSDLMLDMPGRMVWLHAAALVGICFGLSGSSVGLGATFPNPKESDPSKIVSGFGGTLNLVLSLCYIAAAVGLVALVTFLAVVRWPDTALPPASWLAGVLGAEALLAAAMALIPLGIGSRAFGRMEF